MSGGRTYYKGLGLLNVREKPPLVEAGGKYWVVRDGEEHIAVYPDSWEPVPFMEPLPSGTRVTDMEGSNRTT